MELWVSSGICDNYTCREICEILSDTDCQVVSTCSVKSGCIEEGFHIRFITFPSNIKDVWSILQDALDVECGFVLKYNEYQGCINNWPEVFTYTKCPGTCK